MYVDSYSDHTECSSGTHKITLVGKLSIVQLAENHSQLQVSSKYTKERTLGKGRSLVTHVEIPSSSDLKGHEIRHTGSFTCGTCGKSFRRLWNLRQHEKTHTVVVKPYLCTRLKNRSRRLEVSNVM